VKLLNNGILVPILTAEPVIERLGIAKYVGEEEIEQGPKLVEVILEGSTSNKEAVSRLEQPDHLRK